MATATVKTVREFFGMTLAEMKAEWIPMDKADKDAILTGLTDGTFTY